jgi:OmpA-OmpF porin, OOP family
VKKSITRSTLVLVAVGAISAAASIDLYAQETGGFFVSGNAGRSEYKLLGNFGKKNATQAGVGVGYAFNQSVAVELGFNDYGKFNILGADARVRSTHASLLLSAPIASEFSIYGRLGVSSSEGKTQSSVSTIKNSDTEGLYGVGVGYNFAKNIQGTVEYQQLADSDVRAIAAGVKFRF